MRTLKKLYAICALFVVMISCSKSGGDPADSGIVDATWKMGGYTYARRTSNQSSLVVGGANLYIVYTTTSGASNQGAFAGSAVTIRFFDQGPGEYTIVPETAFLTANAPNRIMSIDCAIGTATATGSTLYTYGSGNVKAKVTKVNNQYQVTVDQDIRLNRKIDINGGVAGALTNYDFTCKAIF